MSSTSPGGTGSSKWGTRFEFGGVMVAAVAAGLSLWAALAAQTTAKRVQDIEEERRLDERLEDLAAAQITSYFSAPCDNAPEMLAPEMDRFYDSKEVELADVLEECERGPQQRVFVLHEIDVIGTPDSERAYALVDLGFYDPGPGRKHAPIGVTSLEVVMELPTGWEDDEDPTFPIVSLSETVEAA